MARLIGEPNHSIKELDSILPDILDYDNEFGPELVCLVPTIFWLKESGFLENRKLKMFNGMESFYFFLDKSDYEIKIEPRRYCELNELPVWLANRHEHFAMPQIREIYPDYRRKYKNNLFSFRKPICVINNKYVREWGDAPTNFIPLDILNDLFRMLSPAFQIVYIRQGLFPLPSSFSVDHNEVLAFDDVAVLQKFPEVIVFDDLVRRYSAAFNYNHLKNMLFANTYHFITSQGGGAHHCALFSGSLISVVHVRGEETRFSYASGFYKYYTNPHPTTLVCSNADILPRIAEVYADSLILDGRVHVGPQNGWIADLLPNPAEDWLSAAQQTRDFYASLSR